MMYVNDEKVPREPNQKTLKKRSLLCRFSKTFLRATWG